MTKDEAMNEARGATGEEREWVAEFRRQLGVPGLVDVHTHFMPERVLAKVWRYFDQVGPLTGVSWPITYRHEEDERLAVLRDFGVRAFTSLLYPHKPEMASWLNGWAADFAERTPDCLRTATFYPEESAAGYVREALEGGARVFKSHIQVGDYDPGHELLEPVWGLLEDAGVPTVIHCGSGPTPGRFTGPERIAELLARHPRLRLIVAHMGMPEYERFLDLAEAYEGVYLDTTMVFTDFSERMMPFPRVARSRLDAMGERILFGSDFPNIPYGYPHALEALVRLERGDHWLRAVCHHNAARLFAL